MSVSKIRSTNISMSGSSPSTYSQSDDNNNKGDYLKRRQYDRRGIHRSFDLKERRHNRNEDMRYKRRDGYEYDRRSPPDKKRELKKSSPTFRSYNRRYRRSISRSNSSRSKNSKTSPHNNNNQHHHHHHRSIHPPYSIKKKYDRSRRRRHSPRSEKSQTSSLNSSINGNKIRTSRTAKINKNNIKNDKKNTIEIGGLGPEMLGGAAKSNQKLTNGEIREENSCSNEQHIQVKPTPLSLDSVESQKMINDEVQKQIDAEIQKRVTEYLQSNTFKKELEQKLELERQKQMINLRAEVESEKHQILEEFRRKEEEEKRSKQQLEDILAENEKKVKQEQLRLAEEQAKADEERLIELQKMQQIKEERRKKTLIEKQQNQSKQNDNLLNTRQKIAFKMGPTTTL